MSDQILKIGIPTLLIMHGIGHLLGVAAALGIGKTDDWNSHSWLLTDPIGDSMARMIALILWGITFLGFLAAGAGAFGWSPVQDWWRTAALGAALVSLVALALFWNAFPELSSKIGAIVVNLGTLLGIVLLDFPSTDVIN